MASHLAGEPKVCASTHDPEEIQNDASEDHRNQDYGGSEDVNGKGDHGQSVTPRRSKHKRDRLKVPFQSHAINNARERVEAFHAAHAEVIDEYLQLKDDVRNIAASLGRLEHSLNMLCRNLGKVYEHKES